MTIQTQAKLADARVYLRKLMSELIKDGDEFTANTVQDAVRVLERTTDTRSILQ